MENLSQEKKQEIVNELNKRKAKPVCPMCGNHNFAIADSYFNNPLQDNLSNLKIGGPSIPTIPIICTNCGFVAQHALGVLGLIRKDRDEHEKK